MVRLLFGTALFAVSGFSHDGSIGGTVVDRGGSVIPNASVIIKGVRKAVTDSQGKFLLEGLEAQTYALTFDAPGFKIVTREAIPVSKGSADGLSTLRP